MYSTCSAKNFDYVRGLGATRVFDNQQTNWAGELTRELRGKPVARAFTIGDGAAETCVKILRALDRDSEEGNPASTSIANAGSIPPTEQLKSSFGLAKFIGSAVFSLGITAVKSSFTGIKSKLIEVTGLSEPDCIVGRVYTEFLPEALAAKQFAPAPDTQGEDSGGYGYPGKGCIGEEGCCVFVVCHQLSTSICTMTFYTIIVSLKETAGHWNPITLLGSVAFASVTDILLFQTMKLFPIRIALHTLCSTGSVSPLSPALSSPSPFFSSSVSSVLTRISFHPSHGAHTNDKTPIPAPRYITLLIAVLYALKTSTSCSPETIVRMERAPAVRMRSGLIPGMFAATWFRKELLKMVCAAIKNTAPPRFWEKIRMAIATGIFAAGIRFWIAMYDCEVFD